MKKNNLKRNGNSNIKIMIRDTIIIFVMFIIIGFFCNKNYASNYINKKEIIVQESNTLWTIAGKICKDDSKLDIQKVICDIKKINNMKSSDIYDGQKLYIPVYNI